MLMILDFIPLKLVAACLPLRCVNLGYQCVMRHCIKGSCQVYGHTHGVVSGFLLVDACRCELEERRCVCSVL